MSSYNSLEIGKRALLAQRFGLDVTSNNIANVNTPGYSRRTAVISESDSLKLNGHFMGTGVLVDKLQNFRQDYIDKEIRNANSLSQNYKNEVEYFQRIETILGEPSEKGINELTTEFLNKFNELALKPENVPLRDHLIEYTRGMTERFNVIANNIADLRAESFKKLETTVTTANNLIQEIAKLNESISNSKISSSSEAQSMVDKREEKLYELSNFFDIKVTFTDNASSNVFLNGVNLITENVFSKLEVRETVNSISGERTAEIVTYDKSNNITNSLQPQAGSVYSLLNQYNENLDDVDSSGNFSTAKGFHSFVNALVQNVNEIAITGFGLDDSGTTPPARAFFEPSVGNANGFNIKIADDIINNPRNIPLSSMEKTPGNSDIAKAIARLSTDTTFLNGFTPSGYLSAFIGKVGNMSKEALNGDSTSGLIADQLKSQRESIIGVNLDEEAINLVKYQKSFEASSRIINMTNEILGTIVNLGR